MYKVKRTYSLTKKTVGAIEQMAKITRRDKSAIVEMAIEIFEEHLLDIGIMSSPLSPRLEEVETVDLMAAAE